MTPWSSKVTEHAELLGAFQVGSDAWHAARHQGLGGSEIAAVMGLSPWTSRFTLWCHKAGLLEPSRESSPAMEWGNRLEVPIAGKFADEHPDEIVVPTGTWRSRERPWQIANPDRLLGHNGDRPCHVLEIKTANGMDAWKWGASGTDEIPIYYRVQVLWYLDVLQLPHAWLAVLIGGSDYREYEISYSTSDALILRQEAKSFLDSVAEGRRPDIDESDSTYATVRDLHPDIDGNTEHEIDEELAMTYVAACAEEKAAKNLRQQASSRVLDAMGNARYATWDGRKIALRAVKGTSAPYLRAVPLNEGKAA